MKRVAMTVVAIMLVRKTPAMLGIFFLFMNVLERILPLE